MKINSAVPISALISEKLWSLEKQEQKVFNSYFSILTAQLSIHYQPLKRVLLEDVMGAKIYIGQLFGLSEFNLVTPKYSCKNFINILLQTLCFFLFRASKYASRLMFSK